MPHDHRMRPLYGNHRPTPRLEALLVRKADEGQSSPFLDYVAANGGAQNALNNYRMYRDQAQGKIPRSSYFFGMSGMARTRLEGTLSPATDRNPLPDVAKTVGNVFKERHQ